MSEIRKIAYRQYGNHKNNPRITVCDVETSDGRGVGVAIWNPLLDSSNLKRARQVAFGRAEKALHLKQNLKRYKSKYAYEALLNAGLNEKEYRHGYYFEIKETVCDCDDCCHR